MVRVLLIGSGGRESALATAFLRSERPPELFVFGTNNNPSLAAKAKKLFVGKITDTNAIVDFAKEQAIDLCFIGPEAPLEAGIVDALQKENIAAIGPTQECAQIETSKSFARLLLKKYNLPGNPNFAIFDTIEGLQEYIDSLGSCVIKPDGLTGGKGVLVQGDHFQTKEEALDHCQKIIDDYGMVVVEEKLEGEEFSLMSITDGKTVLHFPPVQDHKRAFANDLGGNTGGMGAYSDYNQLLPFLKREDVLAAQQLNEKVVDAIAKETGQSYKGILYGGFMAVKNGIRLIEYNARFGDPEALNVLSILSTDFLQLCMLVAKQELNKITLSFKHQATVCKYLVPKGYPQEKTQGIISLPEPNEGVLVYPASVSSENGTIKLEGSRAVGVVGIGDTLEQAEQHCQAYINQVKGPVRYRQDIGTQELIQKRVAHMQTLRG